MSFPTHREIARALRECLDELGQRPPLPANDYAEQDLAIKAIKHLGISDSWPPSTYAPTEHHDFWAELLACARRIRGGGLPPSLLGIPTRSPVVRTLHGARMLAFGVTLDATVVVADVKSRTVLFEGSENDLHDVLTSYARDMAAAEVQP